MENYTIQELSARFGLPSSTLRYYEQVGLLVDVIHTPENKRLYTQQHVDRLNAIDCFKRTELPIQKMLEFFEYEHDLRGNADAILKLVVDHEHELVKKIDSMQNALIHIQDKVKFYTAIKAATDAGEKLPAWDEIVLGKKPQED